MESQKKISRKKKIILSFFFFFNIIPFSFVFASFRQKRNLSMLRFRRVSFAAAFGRLGPTSLNFLDPLLLQRLDAMRPPEHRLPSKNQCTTDFGSLHCRDASSIKQCAPKSLLDKIAHSVAWMARRLRSENTDSSVLDSYNSVKLNVGCVCVKICRLEAPRRKWLANASMYASALLASSPERKLRKWESI